MLYCVFMLFFLSKLLKLEVVKYGREKKECDVVTLQGGVLTFPKKKEKKREKKQILLWHYIWNRDSCYSGIP